MERKYIEKEYYVAVFESKNHAVELYYYLNKEKYYQYELVSTPCKIKSGCSYSIKFNDFKYYDFLHKLAAKNNRSILAIYSIKRQNGKRLVSKLNLENKV